MRRSGLKRTGSIIIFHYRTGMDEFEGMFGKLGVFCELVPDDGELRILRRERKMQPVRNDGRGKLVDVGAK